MKLTRDDYLTILVAIAFFVWYVVTREFILLLVVLIGFIPGFFINKLPKLSREQKAKLGLIGAAVCLLLYGIYINDFVVMLKITVGGIAFVYGFYEFGATFLRKNILGNEIKNYQKRFTIAIISILFGSIFSAYIIYTERKERGFPVWDLQEKSEMKR